MHFFGHFIYHKCFDKNHLITLINTLYINIQFMECKCLTLHLTNNISAIPITSVS